MHGNFTSLQSLYLYEKSFIMEQIKTKCQFDIFIFIHINKSENMKHGL